MAPPSSDSDSLPEGSPSSFCPAVLLVDDHPANLLALDAALCRLGLKLVQASSGHEALERVAEEEFALVLLDLRMPGLDGAETAELIRERHAKESPPIILLTADAPDLQEIRKAYARGVVDFLQKPFSPEVLAAKVSAFAQIARQKHQLRRYEEALRKRFEQQLVGIVSHDLRTPLNAIHLSAEVALRRPGTDAKSRHTFEITRSAAGRALRLIHDLLDYTQVLSGANLPIKRGKLCLFELTTEVIEELELIHPEREFVVERTGSTEGHWDPDRLAQALTNLLGNAATYGGDTPITVRLAGNETGVSVAVHNWGEAIPVDVLPELFEPHKRGNTAPGRGSIGFGLFIVREVARAHGGRVTLESTPELGTTFVLELPRSA
jgi:two-component system sensor histidine kinase/response regulator